MNNVGAYWINLVPIGPFLRLHGMFFWDSMTSSFGSMFQLWGSRDKFWGCRDQCWASIDHSETFFGALATDLGTPVNYFGNNKGIIFRIQ